MGEEQPYDTKFVFFIFIPAICSLVTSSLLLINFVFISKHLQSYLYHKMSATLALFDVIQQIGTFLSAPFLLSADADKCAYREYLFLFGSFSKTLTVLFISGTISYVIHYSKVPSDKAMRRAIAVLGVFTAVCFVLLPVYGAQATLCKNSAAGNFHLNSVDRDSRIAFSAAYLGPIMVSYALTVLLIGHTALRLRTMFNSALMKLLVRLLPGPIIFSLAILPSAMFQTGVLIRDKESQVLKVLALLGMNLSGAIYACFYLYELVRDGLLWPKNPAKGGNNDRSRLREGVTSMASDHHEDGMGHLGDDHFRSSTNSITSEYGVEFDNSLRGSSFLMTPPSHLANQQ